MWFSFSGCSGVRVLVGAASQRRVATSGAKSFFPKNEQLFRGIRGSPEVGDVDVFRISGWDFQF